MLKGEEFCSMSKKNSVQIRRSYKISFLNRFGVRLRLMTIAHCSLECVTEHHRIVCTVMIYGI